MKAKPKPKNFGAAGAYVRLDEILFEPDEAEKQAHQKLIAERHRRNSLRRLAILKQHWDEQDQARRKRRVKELAAIVAADRKFVAQENEKEARRMAAEAQTKRIADYYVGEEMKALLARAKKAGDAINRDIVRTERKALEQRGLVRGRRARP